MVAIVQIINRECINTEESNRPLTIRLRVVTVVKKPDWHYDLAPVIVLEVVTLIAVFLFFPQRPQIRSKEMGNAAARAWLRSHIERCVLAGSKREAH
jgi:hypothetical protein